MFDRLKKMMDKYDKVFLVTYSLQQKEWKRICAVLSGSEKIVDVMPFFLIEEGICCPKEIPSVQLSHEEACELSQLYLTYEFSDRFALISEQEQYGTIFNYVDTGILTEEEAVKAILS